MADFDTWMAIRNTDQALDTVQQRNELIRQLYAEINGLENKVAVLKEDLSSTREELKVEQMEGAAFKAQRDYLKSLGVNIQAAYQPSGQFYKSGKPKALINLVYEQAFIAKGKEMGLKNPQEYLEQ